MDPLSWKCGNDYIKSTGVTSWPNSKYDKFLRARTSWTVKSTIQWHVADRLNLPTRPVIDDYKTYQRSQYLPAGWSRYSLPFEDPSEAEFVYQSDRNTRFLFPIPIPTSSDTAASQPRSNDGPLLYSHTTRAYLLVQIPASNCIVATLRDDQKKWAGVIRLHVESESEELTGAVVELPDPQGDWPQWERHEFIAISEGTARNDCNEAGFLEEWDLDERPRDKRLYEFFNVLRVTRKDGICYRTGVGRVLKSAWFLQNPETVEVTLG